MARLRAHAADSALFDCLGTDGAVLATGTLEVEFVPGATRHGSLQFVSVPAADTNSDFERSLLDRVDREEGHSAGGV